MNNLDIWRKNGGIVWNKGKKRPEMTGKNHPMWGKHHKKESLAKMSKTWFKKGEHSSPKTEFQMGIKMPKSIIEKRTFSVTGKKRPRQSFLTSGEKSHNWKGDDVGYVGLHYWVNKNLGKPNRCEICDKAGLTGKQIHWANKDHSYKRNLVDWLRLCVPCHKKYDLEVNKVYKNYG